MIQIPFLSGRALAFAAAGTFVVAACTSAATVTPATPAADTAALAAADDSETSSATADPTAEPAGQSWRDIELTDVTTGDTFTLASLEGEMVAIEPFAVWCTNCHVQQDNVKAAYADLQEQGVRFISIGVEPNESADRIADYRERRGYEWTFTQSPIELSRALADIFGPQVLAVPATPLIILAPDGEVVFQDFGFHGPDSLLDIFEQAAADSAAT